ncbi:hypothetical protein OPV22_001735 [Ensete ventricosum]|uniref:Uncharacterized protein n=1 Tax=Ensete ventricosum TaxID=4639 RepID=A0AAV8RSS8_ENSVE|nr:hypothetical protein OPV22_001735 [Ensete ventricosum]
MRPTHDAPRRRAWIRPTGWSTLEFGANAWLYESTRLFLPSTKQVGIPSTSRQCLLLRYSTATPLPSPPIKALGHTLPTSNPSSYINQKVLWFFHLLPPPTPLLTSTRNSRGSLYAGDGKPQGWLSGAWFGNKKDEEAETKGAGGKSSLQQQQLQKKRRLPRFAVEFDGLNCFETIVPQ